MAYRIGILSIQHEANSFAPAKTVIDDFRRDRLLIGRQMIDSQIDAHHEVGGMIAAISAAPEAEIVPLMMAAVVPGGILATAACDTLLETMHQALANAGPLDGVLVAPHGAAVGEELLDFDGHWLTLLRQRLPRPIPIIATMDLHANLSRRMVDACDAILPYQTNPHLDQRDRGAEAAALMLDTLAGRVKPILAAAMPDIVISMDRGCTDEPPCRTIAAKIDEIRQRPDIITAGFLHGFAYADVPEMGSSFVVVTRGRPHLAQRCADELAAFLWEHREDFRCRLPTIDQALAEVADTAGTITLLDVGDNVGGGSPGDGTILAHAILARPSLNGFVALYDPEAAWRAGEAGVGATVPMRTGAKSDRMHGAPVELPVTVVSLHDGHFAEPTPRHGGRTDYNMGPTAIVTAKNLTIQLTSNRIAPFSLRQLTSCNVDPANYRILVAKGVNAPLAAYRPISTKVLRVDTPGATTANLSALPYKHRRRPLFPIDDASE